MRDEESPAQTLQNWCFNIVIGWKCEMIDERAGCACEIRVRVRVRVRG